MSAMMMMILFYVYIVGTRQRRVAFDPIYWTKDAKTKVLDLRTFTSIIYKAVLRYIKLQSEEATLQRRAINKNNNYLYLIFFSIFFKDKCPRKTVNSQTIYSE